MTGKNKLELLVIKHIIKENNYNSDELLNSKEYNFFKRVLKPVWKIICKRRGSLEINVKEIEFISQDLAVMMTLDNGFKYLFKDSNHQELADSFIFLFSFKSLQS
jgi:hypothetical protein